MSDPTTTPALPTTELANPRTEGLDQLATEAMLARINDEDATVATVVRGVLPQIARAVDAVADSLRGGGRLIYVGAGTSGRLGCLDAAECLPTFGVPPEQVFGIIAGGEQALLRAVEGAEDDGDAGAAAMDAARVGPGDAIVGVSASGGAPYVRSAVRRAKERGASVTISVANSADAPLSGDVDIAIEAVSGPEAIQGSTRLKAGTAQKLILNMLSTGAMVRIGKTYGNRMVDVQATNVKLVRRSLRLIREIGGADSDEAASEVLRRADGSVKLAIVLARLGLEPEAGRSRLREAGGFLAVALGETPG
ncbi:MAG: N-acetylmuramic acid 6-phosphate etherase [Cytophagales bacterium]|nr:N-acetylmuramic acid 6-phosphate etherase [Armatimonadota bacterium]